MLAGHEKWSQKQTANLRSWFQKGEKTKMCEERSMSSGVLSVRDTNVLDLRTGMLHALLSTLGAKAQDVGSPKPARDPNMGSLWWSKGFMLLMGPFRFRSAQHSSGCGLTIRPECD